MVGLPTKCRSVLFAGAADLASTSLIVHLRVKSRLWNSGHMHLPDHGVPPFRRPFRIALCVLPVRRPQASETTKCRALAGLNLSLTLTSELELHHAMYVLYRLCQRSSEISKTKTSTMEAWTSFVQGQFKNRSTL